MRSEAPWLDQRNVTERERAGTEKHFIKKSLPERWWRKTWKWITEEKHDAAWGIRKEA